MYNIPDLPSALKAQALAAIRRVPEWIRYILNDLDSRDDLSLVAVQAAMEIWNNHRERVINMIFDNPEMARVEARALQKEAYNASQRAIYIFLKGLGFRKVSRPGRNGKRKSVWSYPQTEFKKGEL
jgi:hypothetical protein